jgi:transposase
LVDVEARIPQGHPLRRVKAIADQELKNLSGELDQMYEATGRPSIAPERLLKSCLLIALYSVRSERAFCERLDTDLLFQWFLDMNPDERTFDASSFAKNKGRFLESEIARKFFDAVVNHARRAHLLSSDHFTVDGTLIEAWASLKSFRAKKGAPSSPPDDPGNPTVNFHGEKRSNETHASTTDPEAKLMRKGLGKEAKLCFSGHALMENRLGLCVDFSIAPADGRAEREQALRMADRAHARGFRVRTLGADKGYDTRDFVSDLRKRGITPHVARHCTPRRSSAIDGRTTRSPGYPLSQRARKRIEEIFGWMKTVGAFRRTRYRGVERTGLWGFFVAAAYNLVRLARLLTFSPAGAS